MDKAVDQYINKQKSPQKEICQSLRKIFFKHFKDLKEEMYVGVPYYNRLFYIVALKDHVNFGFDIKKFSANEIKNFSGSGKTVKIIEIKSKADVNEKEIVRIIKKVLN